MRHLRVHRAFVRVLVPLSLTCGLTTGAAWAGPPQYRVVELQYPDSANSWADAIDGRWTALTTYQTGFHFKAHRCARKQACTPVVTPQGTGNTTAADVNREGVVVGDHEDSRGFVDDPIAGWSTMPTFDQDCPWESLLSHAEAVNNLGLVVGTADSCGRESHGVTFEAGVLRRIPVPAGVTRLYPMDVNDKRLVVGVALKPDYTVEAFTFNGTSTRLIGTLGGPSSSAAAVNNHGRVAGCSTTADGGSKAFLYEKGSMVALPDGVACPLWMNDADDLVGNGSAPFFYSDGITYRLNDLLRPRDQSTWRVEGVHGINDQREIAVNATRIATNETKVVRLVPVAPR